MEPAVATWRLPRSQSFSSRYFDNPTAVNTSDLKPCSETNFVNDVIMAAYHAFSGDDGGVVVQPDGTTIANCPDGFFWLAPSCRSDVTTCILWFTAGAGYGLPSILQKSSKFNMPLAAAVAKSWATLTPQFKSTFYWWTPDPTFLEMAPVTTSFPDHDKKAYESEWLPDESTCFPKFGMYNTIAEQYVSNRDDKDGIRRGLDLVNCRGTSQASGATLQCDPCLRGEYQDEIGQQFCKRCDLGLYQDEEGGPTCKTCPDNSRTLQKGSFSFTDCGCEEGYIDVATQAGTLMCVECQIGLDCPLMGTKSSLETGEHPLGPGYVPNVTVGYYVTADESLEVYRCGMVGQCGGYRPNNCSGGLTGIPCGECPPGYNMADGQCDLCDDSLVVLWALGTICVFLFLTAAYYLMTSKVTAKASVLFTTTCAFGMLISLLQSIGIIGTMTVKFPVDIDGFFGWFSILLLDLDNFGFACLAGSNTSLRYSVSVLFFPAGIAWFMFNYGALWQNLLRDFLGVACPMSQNLEFLLISSTHFPNCLASYNLFEKIPQFSSEFQRISFQRHSAAKVSQFSRKHRWDLTKVASCMGQFLQAGLENCTGEENTGAKE
eukprot:Skav212734  [mRNA]  locus=scaffold1199:8100:15521:+ [translate_table: standard]